jgi:hypothetical protein
MASILEAINYIKLPGSLILSLETELRIRDGSVGMAMRYGLDGQYSIPG